MERVASDALSFPSEILFMILQRLEGCDVRSVGNSCRRLRNFILLNKSKLRRPQLQWKEVHVVFGRRIFLSRFGERGSSTKRQRTSRISAQWEFTEKSFLEEFANLFLEVSPEVLYLKCRNFDENVADVVKEFVGSLSGKTLAIEMERCLLSEEDFGLFLRYLTPFSLHLTGHFDRSILSDQNSISYSFTNFSRIAKFYMYYMSLKVLPLSSLYSLFVGVNRADTGTRTQISGITVRKIVNNWFQRYPRRYGLVKSVSVCEDYESKGFQICLPDCDLDYNEFFAFLKELIVIPHKTAERIHICNLPKTLILTIARNISSFEGLGPLLWVEEGLCDQNDIKWTCMVTCDCKPGTHVDYNLEAESLANQARICETISLHLGVSVCKQVEMLKPREKLLDIWIILDAGLSSAEASIPEMRLMDTHKRRRRL